MSGLRRLLPKLDLLVAFDAAARHGSFTAAADELGLTQSAVSQRMRQLEDWMGSALFERRPRSVRLTGAGREFHHSVQLALDHVTAATLRLKSKDRAGLHLATDIAMATFWLKPRLVRMLDAFPDVVFNITASDSREDMLAPSVDAALVHGDGNWPGHHCAFLFGDDVVPVCSPGYLDAGGPIDSVEELARRDLIDLAYEDWSWMNWTIWLAEQGVSGGRINRVLRSNSFDATIEAALSGRGVALGWRGSIEEHLAAGRLVVPLLRRVRTGQGYHFVTTRRGAGHPQIAALRDWVMAEVAQQEMGPPVPW